MDALEHAATHRSRWPRDRIRRPPRSSWCRSEIALQISRKRRYPVLMAGPNPAKQQPMTADEWRIHALNIQGQFLEQWVVDLIRRSENWMVSASQLQVGFEGPAGIVQSEIDVVAERGKDQLRLT